MIKFFRASARRFLSHTSGIAAIEFAVAGPVLILALIGSVSAFDLYRADRAVSHASNTVVDLVARQSFMDDQRRDTVYATTEAILGRYGDANSFTVVMASVVNESGDLSIDWTEANTPGIELEDSDIPNLGLPEIPNGESLIFIEIRNEYPAVFSQMSTTLNRDVRRRPRFVSKIAYDDGTN